MLSIHLSIGLSRRFRARTERVPPFHLVPWTLAVFQLIFCFMQSKLFKLPWTPSPSCKGCFATWTLKLISMFNHVNMVPCQMLFYQNWWRIYTRIKTFHAKNHRSRHSKKNENNIGWELGSMQTNRSFTPQTSPTTVPSRFVLPFVPPRVMRVSKACPKHMTWEDL